jgi:PAS domain S-box-containing protein
VQRDMSSSGQDILRQLALVALEAVSAEDLEGRALQVLEPRLGHDLARRVLAADADTTGAEDEARSVRELAHLLSAARTRIRTEQELRSSNARLAASERLTRLLLESAGEGLYAIDLEGRCTAANSEAVRLLGYGAEHELLGHNMHRLAHHARPDGSPYPEEECRIFQAWREGRGIVCDDEVLFRRDGTSFPVEYRSYPIVVDGRIQGSVLTFFDITERKAAELELQQLHADRRTTALTLHDNVVQALATASYAQALGEDETGTRALERAMQAAQELVSQLLADSPIDERTLVREQPSLDDGGAT